MARVVPRLRGRTRTIVALICVSLFVPLTSASASEPQGVVGVGDLVIARGEVRDIGTPGDVDSLRSITTPPIPGLHVSVRGGLLSVAADMSVPMPRTVIVGSGVVCARGRCDVPYMLRLTVFMVAPGIDAQAVVASIASPSPDRLAAGRATLFGDVELRDEVLVSLGTTEAPGGRSDALVLASTEHATLVGGFETLGLYQIRWPEAIDIDAAVRRIEQLQQVADVDPSTWGPVGTTATDPPGDWADDTLAATWPWDMIHAREAWDLTTGSTTKVGIVDAGVFGKHGDLNVSYDSPSQSRHGTHVAGVACAKADGHGIVGVAWGCPIIDGPYLDYSAQDTWLSVIAAAQDLIQRGAQVINISLGLNFYRDSDGFNRCATSDEATAAAQDQADRWAEPFKRMFATPAARSVVWTLSAGNNCVRSVQAALQQAGSAFDNVVIVSAVNSDSKLASFSNWGPEMVAAPGGVLTPPDGDGTTGVWSTSTQSCLVVFVCDSYETMAGTSQAAPVVAGIAALVADHHPDKTATEIAKCIRESVGPPITERSSLPGDRAADGRGPFANPTAGEVLSAGIVDATRAVTCESKPITTPVSTPALDVVQGVAFDHTGAVYIAGYTRGRMSGAPSFGQLDLFLQKHASNGTVQWVSQFGSAGSDGNVAVDVDGDAVYIVGSVDANMPADRSYGAVGSLDYVMRRYNAAGQLGWTTRFDLAAPGQSFRPVAIDATTAGVKVLTTQAGAYGQQSTSSSSDMDCWVWDFSTAGELVNVTRFGSPKTEGCSGIAVTPSGASVVSVNSDGVLPGPGERSFADQNNVAALVSVNPDGSLGWVRRIGDQAGSAAATSVAVSGNTVVLAGGAAGPINGATVREGWQDAYAQWYSLSGDLVGAARWGSGGIGGDTSATAAVTAVGDTAILAVIRQLTSPPPGNSAFDLTIVALSPGDIEHWVHPVGDCNLCFIGYRPSVAAGPSGKVASIYTTSTPTNSYDGWLTIFRAPS